MTNCGITELYLLRAFCLEDLDETFLRAFCIFIVGCSFDNHDNLSVRQ